MLAINNAPTDPTRHLSSVPFISLPEMTRKYASVVVHREHPSPPDWLAFEERNQHPEAGGGLQTAPSAVATVGPFYAPISQGISQPCMGPDCAPITSRLDHY